MTRNAIILTLALAIAALLVPLAFTDESDADDSGAVGIDSNTWFCYGRNIAIRDHNYDPTTYSHIEWRYSLVRADLDTIAPVEKVVLEFSVPFEICADDSMVIYYVRETATVSGQELTEDLEVIINPSSYIRYVQFMYNDGTDTVYMHAPITAERCYKYGVEYLVNPPSKDPIRPGYKFQGWYVDTGCNEPYTKATYKIFDSDRIARLYAKWTVDPSSHPGMEMVKIDLKPVEGLRFDYDGLVIPKGTDFKYGVSIMNKYAYDLDNVGSMCLTDGRQLVRGDVKTNPDGRVTSCSFTLDAVQMDSLVVLTGADRLYYIYEECHDVKIVTGYQNPTHGSLSLRLELVSDTVYNGFETAVWMGGKEVTGNVVKGDRIEIPNVNGDVYIFAHGTYTEHKDFPWWAIVAAAAALAALLLAVLLLRRKKTLVLSSSYASFNPLLTEDFDGKKVQCYRASEGSEPAYVFLRRGKDDYVRGGYEFVSEDLPSFMEMDKDGCIRMTAGAPAGTRGTFTVEAYEASGQASEDGKPSGKKRGTAEFGYITEDRA